MARAMLLCIALLMLQVVTAQTDAAATPPEPMAKKGGKGKSMHKSVYAWPAAARHTEAAPKQCFSR